MSMKQLLATILCLLAILGAGAAPAEEIVGFSAETKDYHYMILGTYPYEEDGTEAPLVWRVLGVQDQVATLFTEDVIDVRQMIELETYKQLSKKKYPRKIQDWTESDLYVWMCGELAETILRQQDFSPAIIRVDGAPFYLLSDEELRNKETFGFPTNILGSRREPTDGGRPLEPLAVRRMAEATPYAKNRVPQPNWGRKTKNKLSVMNYGGVAYWRAAIRSSINWGGIVGVNGHLSWHGMGDVQIGVRPALRLDVTKLRIVGGTGTKEDPWTVEVTGNQP